MSFELDRGFWLRAAQWEERPVKRRRRHRVREATSPTSSAPMDDYPSCMNGCYNTESRER